MDEDPSKFKRSRKTSGWKCSRSWVVALSLRDRKRERTCGVCWSLEGNQQNGITCQSRLLSRSDRATFCRRLTHVLTGDTLLAVHSPPMTPAI